MNYNSHGYVQLSNSEDSYSGVSIANLKTFKLDKTMNTPGEAIDKLITFLTLVRQEMPSDATEITATLNITKEDY